MSDDAYELDLDLLSWDEEEVKTNPYNTRVIIPDPPKPKPVVYKQECPGCKNKDGVIILFNSVKCSNHSCRFFSW